jgi:hypothetical protein
VASDTSDLRPHTVRSPKLRQKSAAQAAVFEVWHFRAPCAAQWCRRKAPRDGMIVWMSPLTFVQRIYCI